MAKIIISVIIPTYNRIYNLKKCLQSLTNQTLSKKKFEIIIVDDGSTQSLTYLKAKIKTYQNISFYKQKHQGPYNARNLGIKKAKGKVIAFTDDDCLPKPNWLKEIFNSFSNNPNILAVEGRTITNKIPSLLYRFIINTKGGAFQTCNIAYKKTVLKRLKGFDPKYFFHCGDTDLALRTLKKGKIIFNPQAIVIHPPKKVNFYNELLRIVNITSELKLFTKFPEYFEKKYGKKNVFTQVIFVNSIYQRLFLIKYQFSLFRKKPFVYCLYTVLQLLEILIIIILTPYFFLFYYRFLLFPNFQLLKKMI